MRLIFLTTALAALATAASAKAIYLECQIKDAASPNTGEHLLRVVLNEDAGTAGYTFKASPTPVPATFSPTEVTWRDSQLAFPREFSINRETLAFHSSEVGINDADWDGKCTVPKANPKRKF